MSIVLELAPEAEARLVNRAREERVAPAELAARLVEDGLQAERAAVLGKLHRWQKETGTKTSPRVSAHELFRRWDEEDAGMSAEEKAAEGRLWEEVRDGINENRAALGMRRL